MCHTSRLDYMLVVMESSMKWPQSVSQGGQGGIGAYSCVSFTDVIYWSVCR